MQRFSVFILAASLVLASPITAQESPVVDAPQSEAEHALRVLQREGAPTVSAYCCKHCHKGKACGNSCISRSYTCHKGPGCACDG
ncbi:hypothetical protein C8J27_10124 [Rhodobacter aestuarii]|uniref:Metallothionein n=1 Tax=Rhodobacter aestuarii TaxID=453582 RepID=A0A1N7JD26_9RHOB|nr:hypothetical protein [Rhodobacter aestuarii]PTV96916.1 hypothetical protein C8J27_10124 [Rhodobacter aestuarii]SIS47210.1 hypothetical protein SAMN05421580_101618 [Rhodobacter aestuarii]